MNTWGTNTVFGAVAHLTIRKEISMCHMLGMHGKGCCTLWSGAGQHRLCTRVSVCHPYCQTSMTIVG